MEESNAVHLAFYRQALLATTREGGACSEALSPPILELARLATDCLLYELAYSAAAAATAAASAAPTTALVSTDFCRVAVVAWPVAADSCRTQ